MGSRGGLVLCGVLGPDLLKKALGVIMAELAADSKEDLWLEGKYNAVTDKVIVSMPVIIRKNRSSTLQYYPYRAMPISTQYRTGQFICSLYIWAIRSKRGVSSGQLLKKFRLYITGKTKYLYKKPFRTHLLKKSTSSCYPGRILFPRT